LNTNIPNEATSRFAKRTMALHDKNWSFVSFIYAENDLKTNHYNRFISRTNQILAAAGTNQQTMIYISAYADVF
jgi:hypothetical protein